MGAKIGVLLNCGQQSQFSKVRREFDAGRVNLDPPMTCADWPVPGNLTLLHPQTAYTRKPLHRQLHRITGRSYQEEATTPSYDLLTAVRTRRHQWLGHILRMPANRLVRRAVLALGQRAGPPYQPGSILMDAPFPLDELVLRAADRRGWARDTRSLSSLQESP